MNELKQARMSLGVFSGAAIAVGFFSSILGAWIAGIAGIAVLVACGYVMKTYTKQKGNKWLVTPVFVYIMFWLVSWTFFMNLGI
jgi:hypothetical protein